MADFDTAVEGNIGLMRFNRPDKMNAITYEMLATIDDSIRQAETDDRVTAILLTGEGRAFSAGTDLQQLSEQSPTTARGENNARTYDENTPAPWTFASTRKPTVCAINGVAVGLGAEFTNQCDIRIAGESARIGWVFVHRGLVPDTGAGTWLLSRIVGLQNAAYLMYSGEIISAQKAKDLGYVLDVVPDADLREKAMELTSQVSKGSPLATGEVKRLLYQGLTRDANDHLKDNRPTLNRMFESEDFKEGVQSFLEKREPAWKGR
ncbi:MAG: enoyl-CoA hydratase/isomerase family protein [Dehalococcoidia bacterium]|nr:enoyl-CoA hydratase/isomerase family protein [Dehalococcoidia bacterium]